MSDTKPFDSGCSCTLCRRRAGEHIPEIEIEYAPPSPDRVMRFTPEDREKIRKLAEGLRRALNFGRLPDETPAKEPEALAILDKIAAL